MKKAKVSESLRSLLRKEIVRVIREAEQTSGEETPVQSKAEEPGVDPALEELTLNYIRRVRYEVEFPDHSDIVEMVSLIVETFGATSEERLQILRDVKLKTIR
jgi:hypothetical protein